MKEPVQPVETILKQTLEAVATGEVNSSVNAVDVIKSPDETEKDPERAETTSSVSEKTYDNGSVILKIEKSMTEGDYLTVNKIEAAMSSNVQERGNLDGGCSWLIVLGSFLTQFLQMGIHNVFGLLYPDLLEEFGENRAVTAWVASIAFGLMIIMGPVSTSLCTMFGCGTTAIVAGLLMSLGLLCSSLVDRFYQLFMAYSLLFATGTSLGYFSSVLVLSEYFNKNLVLANGLGLSGAGVGTLALAPFVNFLQRHLEWRTTVKILSALSFMVVFNGVLYRLVPSPANHVMTIRQTDKKLLDFSVLKNKAYLVLVTVVGLVLFGFYIPYVHLVRHCQDLKIAKDKAAVLVGYLAVSQTLGKIFYGRVADHPRVKRVHLFQLCLLICGVMTLLLPILTSYYSVMAYCWIFGFNDGGFVVLTAVLTGDIVGKQKLAPAFGLLYCITGVPMMLGPPVAGWMYEIYQTYDPAFYMAGAFSTTGGFLLLFVPFLLPPTVKKEWIGRSNRVDICPDLSVSTESSKSQT